MLHSGPYHQVLWNAPGSKKALSTTLTTGKHSQGILYICYIGFAMAFWAMKLATIFAIKAVTKSSTAVRGQRTNSRCFGLHLRKTLTLLKIWEAIGASLFLELPITRGMEPPLWLSPQSLTKRESKGEPRPAQSEQAPLAITVNLVMVSFPLEAQARNVY